MREKDIAFTTVGTYYYLVKEVNGGQTIKGITYDGVVYRVKVEITDDLLGQLHATTHIYDNEGVPQQTIVFRNSLRRRSKALPAPFGARVREYT